MKRIFWVILNILFFGLPLIIYLYVKAFSVIIPLARYDSTPKLTADEKRKVSLIENFPFPNERESLLEALLFVKAKVSFLASEKIDKKNAYWIRLWSAKASQLYQKAEMMFKGDKAANEAYREITAQKERVAKTVKIKAITYTVALLVIIIFLFVRNGTINIDNDNATDYSNTFEWQTDGLFTQLPEPDTNNGRVISEYEKQINIELYHITSEDFDSCVKDCREFGFTIDATKNDTVFYANDDEGYNLSIFYDDEEDVMKIFIDSYDLLVETDNGNT